MASMFRISFVYFLPEYFFWFDYDGGLIYFFIGFSLTIRLENDTCSETVLVWCYLKRIFMPSWTHSFCGLLLLLLLGELKAKEFSLLTDRTYASGFDAFKRCLLNEDQLKCLHRKWHNIPCNVNTNDHEAEEVCGLRIAVELHRLLLISVAFATDSIVSMKGHFIWFTSKSS